MLPIVNNLVRAWFAEHGDTLTDKASFRHMIELAERDVKEMEALMPEYRLHAPDVHQECVIELAMADHLIAAMRSRLAELERTNEEG
jgi:hypothetical protein